MAKLTKEEVIAKVKAGESLAGEDLSGLDLIGADLIGANLSRANLSRADLNGANLSRANLNGAGLFGADLFGANLTGANFSVANLSRANLFGANLSGAYLFGANLFGANPNGADLSRANLTWANLNGADLSRADLNRANLRESNLGSANLAEADLSGADLTGADIWNIATANWKINGVKCEYVYNCKNYWNKEEKENTRRDFAPGEFEQIYKNFPKLELIFKKEFSGLDHRVLLAIVDRSNDELPNANLKVRKLENVGDTTIVTLSAETKEDTEKIADILLAQYARMLAEFARIQAGQAEIKSLLAHQNPQSSSPLPDGFAQLQKIIEQLLLRLDKFPNTPDTVIIGNQPRDFKKKLEEFGKAIGVELSGHTIFEITKEIIKHLSGLG